MISGTHFFDNAILFFGNPKPLWGGELRCVISATLVNPKDLTNAASVAIFADVGSDDLHF